MRHPWLVKAMGRFDPARHHRGQPENAGEFASRGAGASGATGGKPDLRANPDLDEAFGAGPTSRPKPGAPLRPANPDLDAAMGMGAKPGSPAAPTASTGDPFADYVPGSAPVREFPRGATKPAAQRPGLNTLPALPHERTQRQALHAAQAVKPGDARSHAAAVAALDAHLKAGLAELHRRAAHAGPRAGNMYRKAAEAFRAKMSAARAKVDAMAGRGPPPVPRRPGQGPPPLADRGKVRPFVSMKAADSGGRWITIGGSKGADGKRHGGSPVFIKDGKIVKGHPSLTGKKIGALKEAGDESTHRGELNQSRAYDRAVWRKKARKAGHDPKHLDELAAQVKAHHDAFAGERKEVLRFARNWSEKNGFGSLQRRGKNQLVGGREDNQRGIDLTAEATQSQFPHHFREETGEHGSLEDQLREMLGHDDPQPMPHAEAYEQAFNQLGEAPPKKRKPKAEDADPFAFDFGANEKSLALDLAVPHPWLVKSRDATGHEHAADGRFGAGAGHGKRGRDKPGRTTAGRTADPDGKARTLVAKIKAVPAAVRQKVTAFVTGRYQKLSARYGRNGARAILGATILLLPAPVPGSSLIPVAFAEVALRLRRAVMKGGPLDAKTIQAEARALLADLMEHMKGTDQ